LKLITKRHKRFKMEYLKLIAVLFSATGFWKLVELLIRFRSDNRKQAAEIRNLNAQAEKLTSENWIEWSKTLEKRVKELEAVAEENKELKKQIENQRNRICELENKVDKVEKENEQLRNKIKEITKIQEHE
jgi:predicted RNase H-like nuclease (RuvC/YqgF family)